MHIVWLIILYVVLVAPKIISHNQPKSASAIGLDLYLFLSPSLYVSTYLSNNQSIYLSVNIFI